MPISVQSEAPLYTLQLQTINAPVPSANATACANHEHMHEQDTIQSLRRSCAAPTSSDTPTTYTALSASFPSAALAQSSSGRSSGSIAPTGNQWAMAYMPYANGGSCKSADYVSSDISSIKAMGFTTVRIYVDGSGIGSNTDEQVSTLAQWGLGK